jgi:putative ATP-dependent endonuclease of OLD family
MKINTVEINNYRNLDGLKISFSDECNFIVGESNLGKSNFLSLLNIMFSHRSFDRNDFSNDKKPIEIKIQLQLADVEIGHFKDLFTIADYSIINIICKQLDPDDNIEFFHEETNTYLQASLVRCINYVHYNSLRNPLTEINFDRSKGVGRFLNNLVSQYLKDNKVIDKDFIDPNKIAELVKSINQKLSKVKSFKDFDISAMPDDDPESLICKLLILKDGKGGSLAQSGYGVQFLILVTLSILEKLQSIMELRKDKGIFEDANTHEKSISLVLGFDEPEIHLHPYMQRSLIKYICSVMNNNNSDFKQLIKELFEIDNFIGQIIIVTQSPNIILDDYQQIIRFYSLNNTIHVISGNMLTLDPQSHNHLYLNFPFIKEAFFSRCIIFVEGVSEYSCLPILAKKFTPPIDFDDLGICVIQARGNAVAQLITLASFFGIQSVGITDKDNSITKPTLPNLFQTTLRDFEEELISSVNETTLRKIVQQYDGEGLNAIIQFSALNKYAFERYAAVPKRYSTNLKLADIPATEKINLNAFYLTWFSHNKSYPLGKAIGDNLTETEIPKIYHNLINEAIKLV